ncbi:MAG: hypothetical protein U0521_00315 [Anaerolineae bacterium]
MRFISILLIVLALAAGCQPPATPTPERSAQAAQVDLVVDPSPPAVGDASLIVTVTRDGAPLADAPVSCAATITMPGCARCSATPHRRRRRRPSVQLDDGGRLGRDRHRHAARRLGSVAAVRPERPNVIESVLIVSPNVGAQRAAPIKTHLFMHST